MALIKRGGHGDIYETLDECATDGQRQLQEWKRDYPLNIFRDPETGGYFHSIARSFTTFCLTDGTSPTQESVARVNANGEVEMLESTRFPGDIDFSQGSVIEIHAVRPEYNIYQRRTVRRGVRLPSFRKEMRERGYAIIWENPTIRTALARKVS